MLQFFLTARIGKLELQVWWIIEDQLSGELVSADHLIYLANNGGYDFG